MPAPKTEPPLELRDACIVAAQEIIAERGLENLSLREVARKLGVSHQAPYKHYPSRDHLLAEVMRRCFQHRFIPPDSERTDAEFYGWIGLFDGKLPQVNSEYYKW